MSETTRKSGNMTSGKSAKTAAARGAKKAAEVVVAPDMAAATESPSPARRKAPARKKTATPAISPEERIRLIAEAAYYRAEKRGFGGDQAQCERDWLEAEAEVDALLSNTQGNA